MQRDAVVRHLLRVIGRLLPVTSIPNASAPRSGAGARLVNLVVDPAAAFRGIADDPSWRLAILAAVFPWITHPSPANWVTWEESRVNSVARREWTRQAADFLRPR